MRCALCIGSPSYPSPENARAYPINVLEPALSTESLKNDARFWQMNESAHFHLSREEYVTSWKGGHTRDVRNEEHGGPADLSTRQDG